MDLALKKHASEHGEELRDHVKGLMAKRGQLKRVVTVTIKTINKGGYEVDVIQKQVESVKGKLQEVEDVDLKIMTALEEHGVAADDVEVYEQETESQVQYQMQMQGEIAQLEHRFKLSKPGAGFKPKSESSQVQSPGVQLREVKLPVFSGDQKDVMEFADFFGLFEDLVGKHSGASKLLYLKTYLRGSALDVIKHLSNEDENYHVAVEFLKKEYLDKNVLVDNHIRKLCELPAPSTDYNSMRSFMNAARVSVYELKALGFNALDEDCLGSRMISFMLGEKLPSGFKAKLQLIIGTDTPTTKQLLDNYSDVIRSMEKTAPKTTKQPVKHVQNPVKHVQNPVKQTSRFRPAVSTFQTKQQDNMKYKPCKLCDGTHSMLKCVVYTDSRKRLARVQELKLCPQCSGQHTEADCPGKTKGLTYPCTGCGSCAHITALCQQERTTHSHLCLSGQQGHETLLPTTSVVMCSDSQAKVVRALIDHGSQCSYISGKLAEELEVRGKGRKSNFTVKTCIGSQVRVHEVITCEVAVTPSKMCEAEFLIDSEMDLKYTVPGTYTMIQELKRQGIKFADCYYADQQGDTVDNINCLLGVNTLTHLTPLTSVSLGLGTAYEVQKGLILFGDPMKLSPVKKDVTHNTAGPQVPQSLDGSGSEDTDGSGSQTNRMGSHCEKKGSRRERAVGTPHSEKCVESDDCPAVVEECSAVAGECSAVAGERPAVAGERSAVSEVYPALSEECSALSEECSALTEECSALTEECSALTGECSALSEEFSALAENERALVEECSELTEDEQVLEDFKNAVELRDGKYFVKIPFHTNVEDVPDNFETAMSITNRVHQSLKRKNLEGKYSEVFQQQLADGIIEEIDLSEPKKRVFIPHHPVIKMDEQTTTKIRPVFNCSYKEGNRPSLNEACYPGVNLQVNMVDLLHRFRTNKHTLTADIERAFLQIYLKDDADKDKFCFVWRTDDGVKAYRYCTILFGLNASPFILNHVLQLHIQQHDETETTLALRKSLYVDNFLYTASQLDKLENIYHESIEILREGGFNLRSWKSNHPEMLSMMEEDGTLHKHSAPKEKTLGYLYNIKDDTMSLADFKLEDKPRLTKRQLLSNISKVFDPLCLTLPVTIRGRLLMKQVWQEGTEWDQEVSDDVQKQWEKLKPDLLALTSVDIPRQSVDLESDEPVTLHVFCDGSKSCYGVACYLQQGDRSSLLHSHSKLAPEKKSIPQTELLAVIQALDCVSEVEKSLNLKPKEVFIWCDAQVVLEWLHSGAKTKSRFTHNRLKTAHEQKKDLEERLQCDVTFKYVNTQDNVADMVTRGLTYGEFKKRMDVWLFGPSWLIDKDMWPLNSLNCLSEATKKSMKINTRITVEQALDPTQLVMNPEEYSSLRRLYGVTARVYQFINKLKHRDADSYKQAEDYWISYMQKTSFPEELQFLQDSTTRKSGKPPKLVNDLNLFKDNNGVLRCKGRLAHLNFYSHAALNPVLVAKDSPITALLIRDQHEKCKHLGIGTTLTSLRERGYWIPGGRQVVKRILKGCVTCQKLNNLAFSYPKLTDLPKERVRLLQPFHDTAIDYTGHVYVYNEDGTASKVYIVLYTCMAIRAVHLDLVPDLTVKSFIQSFRRFCSVFCVPQSLYTDNARYFLASQRVLENIFLSDEFREHLRECKIQHRTIPAYASWVGGVYERQVKTIKQCLHKTVGRAKLDYFELLTHLAEIQNVVNSRPITYVTSDLNDVEPLTPNKLLKCHTNPRLQLIEDPNDPDPLWVQDQDEMQEQLNETVKKQEELIDKYRRMWYSQYLLSLRETARDVFSTEWSNRIAYVIPDDQRVRGSTAGLYAFEVPAPWHRPASSRAGSGTSESSDHGLAHIQRTVTAAPAPPLANGAAHQPNGDLPHNQQEDESATAASAGGTGSRYADSDAASTASSGVSCHLDLDDLHKGFVVAYHRKMERQEAYLLSAQKTRPLLFGLPVMVRCGGEVSGSDLYRGVWTQVARLVSPLPPASEQGLANHAQDCDDSLGYKYPFVLKCVNKTGSACSHCAWHRFCRGCVVSCTDALLPATPAYLAIDWDPTALHLRYLGGQEKVCLEDASVPLMRQRQTEPIDLNSCLQAFTREEALGEQEKYYCSKCKTHQLALKKLQIWRLPPILIVHLKRFQSVGGRWVKSQKVVNFPFKDFDPTDYLASVPRQTVLHHRAELGQLAPDSPDLDWDVLSSSGDSASAAPTPSASTGSLRAPQLSAGQRGRIRNGSVMYGDVLQDFHQQRLKAGRDPLLLRYRLYALSCHTGIMGGGHYVCYAKNDAGKWFFYNDSSCKEVPESQIDTNSAYILFYERDGIDYDSYMPKVTGKPVNKEEVQQEYESEFKKVCAVM